MDKSQFTDSFFDAVLTLKTREECYKFFGDPCTPKEIATIAQRFAVAKMLNEKKVYNEIIEATGASTATISRVSRAINEGFQTAFERLK
ncbi:MAG: YerC/YecD family TrpR-related protein [Acutalibacteraceae bacterium]|nr:YerC/YecD family TrpR-related protein [Acutalibacteraceae bacterium]